MNFPSPPMDPTPPTGSGFGPPEGYGPAQGFGPPQGYGQGPGPAGTTPRPTGYGAFVVPPAPAAAGPSGPKVAAIFIAGVLTTGLAVAAFLFLGG